jgi:spore germination protein
MFRKLLSFLFFFTFSWMMPLTAYAQVIHEVKSGDSLFKISNQYDMNLGKIAQLNDPFAQSVVTCNNLSAIL